MTETINVCAYCRVSTDSKDQENSFENQKRYFERETEKRNPNFKLVEIYAEKGTSGTTFSKREEFKRMLYDAGLDIVDFNPNKQDKRSDRTQQIYVISDREPKFKYILTKNTSRFARNMEVISIIRKLKQKGVYVHFVDIDRGTESNKEEMLLQMLFNMDENESRDKSTKVKWGIIEGAKNGVISTNSKLYGYNYIQAENRLEIIEDEANNVRLVFEMYSKGFGIRKILNYLNENGIRTRVGKDFSKSTISKMLENEKYAGINARMKYDTGEVFTNKHSPKLKPKEEWIITENTDKIPPIISKEMFELCQEIRRGKVNTINQKGIYKGVSEFAGMLKCSICGSSMTRNVDRGRAFYNCSLKKSKGTKACFNDNISLKQIEYEIDKFCEYGLVQELEQAKANGAKQLLDIERKFLDRIDTDSQEEVENLKAKKRELNTMLENYAKAYARETLPADVFDNLSNQTQAEMKLLESKIFELSKSNDEILQDLQRVYDALRHIGNIKLKANYTRDEIMDTDVKCLIIYPKNMTAVEGDRVNFVLKSQHIINELVKKVQKSN